MKDGVEGKEIEKKHKERERDVNKERGGYKR